MIARTNAAMIEFRITAALLKLALVRLHFGAGVSCN